MGSPYPTILVSRAPVLKSEAKQESRSHVKFEVITAEGKQNKAKEPVPEVTVETEGYSLQPAEVIAGSPVDLRKKQITWVLPGQR